jgi:hypothetical protein
MTLGGEIVGWILIAGLLVMFVGVITAFCINLWRELF